MATNSASYHEPQEAITEASKDLHRAMTSIQEELEAVDWYQQRADATQDSALRRILEHNRDEEKEHAAMVLEWARRNDPIFAQMLRRYLFTEGEITEIEEAAERAEATPDTERAPGSEAPDGLSLTVGSLLGSRQ